MYWDCKLDTCEKIHLDCRLDGCKKLHLDCRLDTCKNMHRDCIPVMSGIRIHLGPTDTSPLPNFWPRDMVPRPTC